MYTRKCPECQNDIAYKSKYRRNYAEGKGFVCASCSARKVAIKRWKGHIPGPKTRECPSCGEMLVYASKRNRERADENNSVCNSCAIRVTPESIQKISETLKGRKYPPGSRKSNTKKEEHYFRVCPECETEIGYNTKYARDRANKKGSVCNSCASYLYKKSWIYRIKDEHIKKMAAAKAGYDTYEEYMSDLDERKKYWRKVRQITRKQPIETLYNADKLRGLNGTDGAYQVDHIISIKEGYETGVPAEEIGHITNLQIIPWKKNLRKGA